MNLCPATFVGSDGWHYSCDKALGHDGPHIASDFDPVTEAFKEAEWGPANPDRILGLHFDLVQQKHHPESCPADHERKLTDHFPEDDLDDEP